MSVATALPVATAVEILTHASPTQSAGSLTSAPASPSAPIATPTRVAAAASTATSGSPAAASPSQPTAAPTSQPTIATYAGSVVYDQFGPVQGTVTVTGKRISNVVITTPTDPRSVGINSQAVPLLIQETLQAQSANINVISGATETSTAYMQSLQVALNRAHL